MVLGLAVLSLFISPQILLHLFHDHVDKGHKLLLYTFVYQQVDMYM